MIILQWPATAATLRQGIAALGRADYVRASAILIPLAEQGSPDAQSYLGLLYATGRGVPQNYTEAAHWYLRAAEQGHATAQYFLGLLYDKGHGVERDVVEAHKWLTLSTARSHRKVRDDRVRIRDAIASKMTRGEIARSRAAALNWIPRRELPWPNRLDRSNHRQS